MIHSKILKKDAILSAILENFKNNIPYSIPTRRDFVEREPMFRVVRNGNSLELSTGFILYYGKEHVPLIGC